MSTISGFNSLMAQAYNQPNQQIENAQRQAAINAAQVQAQREQAQIPLIQQQTQQAQLQNQLTQQEIEDQRAIGKAWVGWDPTNDPAGKTLLQSAIQNGARPQSVMAVQQHMAQYNANLATADKVTLENNKARNDDFSGKIQAIIDADPKDQDNLISTYKDALLADDPRAQVPDHFGLNEFKALQKVHQYQSTQADLALKGQQTREAAALAAKADQDARREKALNDILDQTRKGQSPQAVNGVHPIDAVMEGVDPRDPMRTNFRNQFDQGKQIPAIENGIARFPLSEKAVEAASAYSKMIAEANSPQKRAGEAATSAARATAEIPARVATTVAEEKAKADLALPGFNSIIEPGARMRAETAYQKINEDYQSKVAAAQQLNDLAELVQQGNKAAAGRIPMATVRGFTSRFNKQELESVGAGAGNALDRVNAFLEHNFSKSGADISPDVLKDMQAVNAAQDEAAYNSYKQQVDVLSKSNGLTGAKAIQPLERIPVRHAAGQAANQATGAHIIRVGGKRYQYKGSGDTADLKNYMELK